MEIKVRMGKHEGMDTDNLDKKVCHDIYVADKKDQKWLAASSGNYFFLALFYPKTGQHLISLCLCRMEVYSNYFSSSTQGWIFFCTRTSPTSQQIWWRIHLKLLDMECKVL